jgi:hypothetical protein
MGAVASQLQAQYDQVVQGARVDVAGDDRGDAGVAGHRAGRVATGVPDGRSPISRKMGSVPFTVLLIAMLGDGPVYIFIQAATAAVLLLAANTA